MYEKSAVQMLKGWEMKPSLQDVLKRGPEPGEPGEDKVFSFFSIEKSGNGY